MEIESAEYTRSNTEQSSKFNQRKEFLKCLVKRRTN